MILDLGCGKEKVKGAVGVDNVLLPGVDVVHDLLDFPYPFEDESAKKIYLNHVIEHFTFSDIQKILQEVHRILRLDGMLYIRVPHVSCVAAWIDPTHKMMFTFSSLNFLDKESPKAYYKEIESNWHLESTRCRVTWFNWKKYRLQKLDLFLSKRIEKLINWLLSLRDFPASADLLVKRVSLFFVEIRWTFSKSP